MLQVNRLAGWEIRFNEKGNPLYYNKLTRRKFKDRPVCLDDEGRVKIPEPEVEAQYRRHWYDGVIVSPDEDNPSSFWISFDEAPVRRFSVHREQIRQREVLLLHPDRSPLFSDNIDKEIEKQLVRRTGRSSGSVSYGGVRLMEKEIVRKTRRGSRNVSYGGVEEIDSYDRKYDDEKDSSPQPNKRNSSLSPRPRSNSGDDKYAKWVLETRRSRSLEDERRESLRDSDICIDEDRRRLSDERDLEDRRSDERREDRRDLDDDDYRGKDDRGILRRNDDKVGGGSWKDDFRSDSRRKEDDYGRNDEKHVSFKYDDRDRGDNSGALKQIFMD